MYDKVCQIRLRCVLLFCGNLEKTRRSSTTNIRGDLTRESDVGKINVVALMSQKLLQKRVVRKNGYFWSFCSLEAKPLIFDEICGHVTERAFKELSYSLFAALLLF